jgi:exodeoxyribonuclease VII large subunit
LRPDVLSADIARSRARLAETEPRLLAAMARLIGRKHEAVDNYTGRLATHSERHESLLARGYVVVRDAIARVVTTSEGIAAGAPLDLEFHDGRVGVVAGSRPRPRTRRPAVHPGQGSLF